MELFLQFGYGMMDHCRALIGTWGGGTVILSPRDMTDRQLRELSKDIRKIGGQVLFDPQFYLPHADHKRLCSHDYWPNDYETAGFWAGQALSTLLRKVVDLNNALKTPKVILPGLLTTVIDDIWLAQQRSMIEEAGRMGLHRPNIIATVALGSDVIKNGDQIHTILENTRDWTVSGIYLICEHPQGSYLVEEPSWLANVLDLVAGLRLKGYEVIIGYSNHQMLSAAIVGATAIASGTWMNVRSFPPDKFRAPYEEEVKQRKIWYYCPQALSEFKTTFLSIAYQQGILDEMAPRSPLASPYVSALFSGANPTTVGFQEPSALRHYLHSLMLQTRDARKATFQETVDNHERILDEAERLLSKFHALGINGQARDFSEIVDVNKAALRLVESWRGPMLRRYWSRLL